MKYIIYKTTNNVTGNYYIGATNSNNPGYLGSGRVLHDAIKKHGKENFTRETLEICDSEAEMYLRETHFVTDAVVNDKNSYNIARGGRGGPGTPKSDTHKQKISAAIKKKYANGDYNNALGSNAGRKPAMDNAILIATVEKYGRKVAANKLNLTFEQCHGRYFRAKAKLNN